MNLPASLEQMLQDSWSALRLLKKNLGTTTAIFSVVEAVLLRQLPYRDAARLTVIWDSPVNEQQAAGRSPATVPKVIDSMF